MYLQSAVDFLEVRAFVYIDIYIYICIYGNISFKFHIFL